MDHSVTHPTEYDWYLNSHAGLQGTSKSAHYHVLHDDTRTPIDELQAFTYHTTYLYCRHVYFPVDIMRHSALPLRRPPPTSAAGVTDLQPPTLTNVQA